MGVCMMAGRPTRRQRRWQSAAVPLRLPTGSVGVAQAASMIEVTEVVEAVRRRGTRETGDAESTREFGEGIEWIRNLTTNLRSVSHRS